jgi:hypothetical protein
MIFCLSVTSAHDLASTLSASPSDVGHVVELVLLEGALEDLLDQLWIRPSYRGSPVVNALLTIERRCVWYGGSASSIDIRDCTCSGVRSINEVPPRALENVSQSFDIAITSS